MLPKTPEFKSTGSCAICGRALQPFSETTFTAHEFMCYRDNPNKIPAEHKARFEHELAGERRSAAAKRGVETRRQNKGKRAPR